MQKICTAKTLYARYFSEKARARQKSKSAIRIFYSLFLQKIKKSCKNSPREKTKKPKNYISAIFYPFSAKTRFFMRVKPLASKSTIGIRLKNTYSAK